MINMIKMDLYHMFRTKSLYVIWLIMALSIIFTTVMEKQYGASEYAAQEQQVVQYEDDNFAVGMTVCSPTKAGEKVTVFDLIYANTQAKTIALFIVIFTILFSLAEINNGYIKNIAGQVSDRGKLVISKVVSLFVFTVFTFAILVILQVIMNPIVFGYLKWGNVNALFGYVGTQICLHFAFATICMAMAVLLRSNVISMIVAICMCMNVTMVLYKGIEYLVEKCFRINMSIREWVVTGKISILSMNITQKESLEAIGVALIFVLVMTAVSYLIFKKRDI